MLGKTRYGNIGDYIERCEKFHIPAGEPYFCGASERCVEIPFVFSSIGNEQKILDVGISLADQSYFCGLLALVEQGREIHGCDIVPIKRVESRFSCFDQALIQQIHFCCQDIRYCSYKTESFDLVLCVSVLEHIGFDKYIVSSDTVFDRPFIDYPSFPELNECREDERALAEMLRIVRPGGKLFVTVPYGSGGVFSTLDSKGRYAMHLEYNATRWNELKSMLPGDIKMVERFFKHCSFMGWQEVSASCTFSKQHHGRRYTEEGVLCCVMEKAKGRDNCKS